MSIIRCSVGHFFDDEKYDACPTCSKSNGPRWKIEDEKTISLDMAEGTVERIQLTAEEMPKQSVRGNWDNERTVALGGYQTRELPVGWLVCISGEMKGKDYRLYSGFNRVGRNMDSDICIQDFTVSKDAHCSVVYDEKGGQFYLVPGKGTLTYHNGECLQDSAKLQEGDRIGVGESILEFIPFCKGDHTWKTL